MACARIQKQQGWQKNSEDQSELGEADQQSSQLQFIRMLLAHCFIGVDSQIIPWRSSMDECIWDRSTAASSCHYDSCPPMLPGAPQSKHNGPFWTPRTTVMKSRASCGHTVTCMLAMVSSLLLSKVRSSVSAFRGLVCQPTASWRSCGEGTFRKLHIC